METNNPRNNNNNNRNYNNNNQNNNRNFNNNSNGGDRGGKNFNNNNNGNGNSRNNYNNNGNFRNNNNNGNNNYNKNFNNNNTNGYANNNEIRVKSYPSELPIATNYFRFSHLNPNRNVYYKYSVEIENIPDDSKKLRSAIYRCARPQLSSKLGKTIFNNTLLYSKTLITDSADLFFSTNFKDTEYKLALKYTNIVENESFEALALYKRYFNTLISQIDFIDMKGSYFDAKNACVMRDYNLDIWSGFAPTVSQLKKGILLNLNVTHKVIRYETVLDMILNLKNNYRNQSDFAREVQAQIQNVSVITRYNGETNFIIDSICLDKSPRDVFEVKVKKGSGPLVKKENKKFLPSSNDNNYETQNKSASGSKSSQEFEIKNYSYIDYYWEKYGKKIIPDQPLLKVINKKRNNQEIFLVPELCYLTGLTENMRSNFNMMKDMNAKTKGNPTDKLKETQDLIQRILNTPGGKKAIEDWEIELEPEVIRLKGIKINTGNVLMAQQRDGTNQRLKIDIDATPDLDRKIQTEMYSQPHLNNWVIAYQAREKNAFESFQSTLSQVFKTFNYVSNPPIIVEVSSPRFEDWKDLLKSKVTPQTQMVCCLIQGNRGNGALYKPLKNFFLTERPIPSQIMLSGTINKPKGLRSVVNKILMQICAKIGGEPWALEDLPFTKEPTMVCAVECYDKKNLRAPLMAMCATYNSMFTKYSSFVKEAKDGCDSTSLLGICLKEALTIFKENNKIFPKHIILFKDSLNQSRFSQVIESDVRMLENAVAELESNLKIPITYLTLNKKTSVKLFYEESNNLSNCPPGTVIQDEITCENQRDFYLISQKTTQGVAQPTHYYIAYDNKGVVEKDIQTLVYRLCYLYYNWTGAVRIPAPCQNVKKLIRLITEKCSDKNNTVIPAERLYKQLKCMYYL